MIDQKDTSSSPSISLAQQAESPISWAGGLNREDIEALPTEQVRQMAQQLRVHQNQLEVENQHLRAAQVKADASRARYVDLYDMSPLAYCTLGQTGLILKTNLTMANLLGMPRGELLMQPFSRFVFADDKPAYELKIKQLLLYRQSLSCELRMLTRNKTPLWVYLTCTIKEEADGTSGLRIGVSDITEQRQSQKKQRIAAIAFESLEGMFITDTEGMILQVNKAFTHMSGYRAEDIVGQTRDVLNSGRQSPSFFTEMRTVLKRDGNWSGEIWDRRKNGEVYPTWMTITAVTNSDDGITHFVFTLTDITLRKVAEEQIRNLAFYDPLTKLPNRRLMLDRLEHALSSRARQKRAGAVMMIDLDNFKTLNDSLGHDVGDKLLLSVALRLESCIREGDTVARMGGDEFVVVIEDLDETILVDRQAESVAQKIITHLNEPYLLQHDINSDTQNMVQYHCSCSIGISLFSEQSITVDELIKQADTAMYAAKAAGRNTFSFFAPRMQTMMIARAAMENDLRAAINKQQLVLHYQPLVSRNNKLMGVEALLRLQHPERGTIMPEEFIPVAEASGLILPLGLWVLQNACDQLAKWAAMPEMAELSVAVNVSAMQFHQTHFVSQVMAELKRSGANPLRLNLELTESVLIYDLNDVIEKMEKLKACGIGFSLDDFGTGYSSLSYLKRLPLDRLKIDQSFIIDILKDPDDAAIAQMIIALSQSMGLEVSAEGVESQAQLDYLAKLGCHVYQGYLFSRPLSLSKFETFARQH